MKAIAIFLLSIALLSGCKTESAFNNRPGYKEVNDWHMHEEEPRIDTPQHWHCTNECNWEASK